MAFTPLWSSNCRNMKKGLFWLIASKYFMLFFKLLSLFHQYFALLQFTYCTHFTDNENGYEDDENVSPLLRSVSKISTIPEEDPEHDAYSQAGAGQLEACRTPLGSAHHLRPLARAVQVPNRIRRLRSRAVGANSKKVWYTGSTDRSFNSKCSKRFETKDLEQDAVHYYYYRSLPAIQTRERYLPSITSSLENIESPTKLPNVVSPSKKRNELLLL